MENIQMQSLAIGAFLTALVGIVVYFLNQIILFKNRIYWSTGPHYAARPDTGVKFGKIESDGRVQDIKFIDVTFLMRVKAWSPVRRVIFHLDNVPDEVRIWPETPFKIEVRDKGVEVTISSLNSGLYSISAWKFTTSYGNISVKGVEADNATSIKRDEAKRGFEPPIWWSAFARPQLVLWGVFLSGIQIYQLLLQE